MKTRQKNLVYGATLLTEKGVIAVGRHTTFESISKMVRAIELLSRPEGANAMEIAKAGIVDRWNVPDFITKMESLNSEGFGITIEEFTPDYDRRQTRYRISDVSKWNMTLPGITATPEESALISLLINQAKKMPVLKEASEGIENKINWLRTVPNLEIMSVENIGKKMTSDSLMILTFILNAIKDHKSIRMKYYAAVRDKKAFYDVFPLKVFVYDGGIYLRAQKHGKDYIQTFALERIIGHPTLVDTPDNFVRVEDNADYDDPFGPFTDKKVIEAVIHMDSWQGWYEAQRNWPSSVSFIKQEDGSYIMKLKTRHEFGLIQWILKQGSSATVIEPEELRDNIKNEIASALKNYECASNCF